MNQWTGAAPASAVVPNQNEVEKSSRRVSHAHSPFAQTKAIDDSVFDDLLEGDEEEED